MGRQAPLRCCWRTAPTAVSEASVIRQVGASGVGYERRKASARSFLGSPEGGDSSICPGEGLGLGLA